jgi:hypothetical protein
MKKANWSIKHLVSSVVMILSLIWLTISLPYTYAAQQKLAKEKIGMANEAKGLPGDENNADENNPFANTTEEKAPTNVNLTEEYLHHQDEPLPFSTDKLSHSHHHSYDVYIAFYGELLSPPPDSFLL